jgi:hypothetical protein
MDNKRNKSTDAVATSSAPARPEIIFYHVAPRAARESIIRRGLNSAAFSDRYWNEEFGTPLGNYLWRSQEDALDWAAQLTPQDVWAVDISAYINELQPDDCGPNIDDYGDSYYIEGPIAPEALRDLIASIT